MASNTTPMAEYYEQIMRDNASKTGTAGALGQVGSQVALTIGLAGSQAAADRAKAQQAQTQVKLANQYTAAMAGSTLGQLGITAQETGIQKLGTEQQAQLAAIQNPIEQEQYGLSQQALTQQATEANRNYTVNKRKLQNAVSTSGAQNAPTQRRALGTINREYNWQMATINRKRLTSGLSQTSTLASQRYSTEQIANAQKNLTLVAKANGLSQQQVLTRLNYALANNSLQGVESITTLLGTKLPSVWAGALTKVGTTLGTTGFINGVNLVAPGASKTPTTTIGK